MIHRVSLYTILSMMLISIATAEPTGTLTGTITDDDNLSLPGANILIPELETGTASDVNGNYRLSNLPAGEYTVKVMFIGYLDHKETITIRADRTAMLNVTLIPGIVELHEVTVIGDRLKGQAKALNQQKNAFNITHVVSADQIGRFPDQNIGDALKRIPGFSVNYNQGEARYANVRGTSPRLNSIMINGDRIPSAEGDVRAVQLDLIPADMIQTIEVNKAITPDMDADAVGGAVNLITRQAPHVRRVSLTLGSGYNALTGKPMLNGSFILGQRFYDDKFGVVLSGSRQDHQLGSDNTEGEWEITKDGFLYPDEWDVRTYFIRRLRRSLSVALDYQIDPNNKLFFETMYNHRDDWENRFRLRYELEEPDKDGFSQKTQIRRQVKGGIDTDRNDNARLEDQRTTIFSFKGKHFLGNVLDMDWKISYAKASEERPHERYLEWQVEDIPVRVDLSNTRTPYFDDPVSYDEFAFKEMSEEYRYTDEVDLNAKIDFELPLVRSGRYTNEIKCGARFKGKDKKRDNLWYDIEPVGSETSFYNNMTAAPLRNVDKEHFLAGDYNAGSYSDEAFLGSRDFDNDDFYEKKDKPSEYAAANYNAREDVAAAYIQLNQHLSEKLKMKAGVRIERTTLSNDGNQYDENTDDVTPQSGKEHYTNILPGLHFKYEMDDHTVFRLALTKTLARPDYDDLVPFREISRDQEELVVGNPSLKPTLSKNFDLTAERYFSNIGLASVGLFYKDITDFIYIARERDYLDDYTGNLYEDFYEPRNGAAASLFGFEFALQRQLTFLPGLLSNFGIYVNYTYTESKTENPEFGDKHLELPGSAPHTLNVNVTYEVKKMLLGLSFNYTSPYLDPDDVILTTGLERYYDKVTYLDMNGSYRIVETIRFFFEANNLLNQPLRYYAGSPDRTYQQEYYNWRLTAGFKFDM